MTYVYNWFTAQEAFNTLERQASAQTKVIDSQSKVIAKLEERLKTAEGSTNFLIKLLAENGLHGFDCAMAQSMRAGETHRFRPSCDCWIDKIATL